MRGLLFVTGLVGCTFKPGGQGSPQDAPAGVSGDTTAPLVDGVPPTVDSAVHDAMIVPTDAAFSVDQCPSSYDQTIGSSPGSRYRYISTAAAFAVQHAACNADHPGWTHLVAFDDMAEAMAVGQLNQTDYSYVGAVQQPNQTVLDANWHIFTGGAVTTGWSPMGPQPDDLDGTENGQEQVAVVASTGNMHDVGGGSSFEAVCECDGHAIDATVATYIP